MADCASSRVLNFNGMSVLHTATEVGKASFGVGAAVLGLAKAQQNLGLDVAIWSCDTEPERLEIEKVNGLRPGTIQIFPRVGPHRLCYCPSMEQAADGGTSKYQILHQHGIWTGVSRVSNSWREASRSPTIIDVQGSLDSWALRRSRWKKALALAAYEHYNLHHASCFHALSVGEMDSIRELGIRCPVAIVPNGISSSWLQKQGNSHRFRNRYQLKDDRVMLFLGRITPKKGLPMFLRAMAKLKHQIRGWKLLIAGINEFGHEDEVRAQAEQLGLSDHVHFIGAMYGQEKQDALVTADLFILPSYSEGSPIAILEAMACGVPVLTTKASPWEILNAQGCGWCTEISQDALIEALADALTQSPSALRAKGSKSRALIAAGYTWEKIAEYSVELYDWLIFGGQTPEFVCEA